MERDAIAQRLAGLPDVPAGPDFAVLSINGGHFDPQAEGERAYIYSPLNAAFEAVVFVKEFPALYDIDFTYGWIGKLLEDMGQGSRILFEIPSDATNAGKNLITFDGLKARFADAGVERLDGQWVSLAHSEAALACHFATTYQYFHGAFEAFCDAFERYGKTDGMTDEESRALAFRQFVYSLFGVHQKAFITGRILADGPRRGHPLDFLDLGGGYGFLGAELCAAGHRCHVVDNQEENIRIGHWLAERCHLENRLQLSVGDIVDITDMEGSFDVVSYFGCLLYVDRELVPDVLRASVRLLRPGGALIIHENPKGVIKPGGRDYEKCFAPEELNELLTEHAGSPRYYNIFNGNRIGWDAARGRLLVAAVFKE